MAPVYHGQWSYNIDTLYATSSCGHVHPRATYSELEDIFSTALGVIRHRPDNPSHWYEAQLLHFGLPPTKYKATAKMRLMDAFQDGTLHVPEEILRIEETLNRNWIKQDLEARILGPSMRPSLDPGITTAPVTDTTQFGAQRQSDDEQRNLFSAGLAGGAGIQGNMRSQRNDMQPPHAQTMKRKDNGEPSTRPMKTARCRDETGEPDLQVQIHINPNGESFQHISTVIPKSLGNRRGRARPAPDGEVQQIGYQTVPLSHQTVTQLPLPGRMDVDGASDYFGYGYKSAKDSSQPGWSFRNRESVAKV